MDKVMIDGTEYRGDCIELAQGGKILLIQGKRGMLGCGYVSLAAAEKFGHALAVVSGVASYDDMLAARVGALSAAAAVLGVEAGMTGREALERMG
jgi:uncharacterized protein YunC (DUF1805 family)